MKFGPIAKALKENADTIGTIAFGVGYATTVTFVAKGMYEEWKNPNKKLPDEKTYYMRHFPKQYFRWGIAPSFLKKEENNMAYPKLVLYIGKGCPFCTRVTDFLDKNPMPVEIKEVWSNDEAFAELQALAGKTQVPCLKIDDDFMHESLDIIEKLKAIQAENAM